jgi:hypothetical protein
MDARHLHLQGAHAGNDRARIGVAVANDLPPALLIQQVGALVDPRRGFDLDGLNEHLPGATPQHLGQRIGDGRINDWKSK